MRAIGPEELAGLENESIWAQLVCKNSKQKSNTIRKFTGIYKSQFLFVITSVKNMLDITEIQHQLSLAYIHAVASYAGCAWEPTHSPHIDGKKIDGRIFASLNHEEGVRDTRPELRIQAKSTRQARHQPKEENPHIHYSFDNETYKELREPNHSLILFVLFVLPEDFDLWVNHSEAELIARQCAYWHSIKNCPENHGEKTIKISRNQIFSPQQVKNLINKIARGEEIPNGCN
jgi:hypothetical protein